MSSQDQLSAALIKLRSLFSDDEAMAIYKILKADLKTESEFEEGLKLVLSGVPVQQVVGYTQFLDCRIELSPDVLIPRPETEELVELILSGTSYPVPCTLLDIGTGSGCIPIAIASKRPEWKVYACDVSSEALKMAVRNVQINKVMVELIHHDILSDDNWILPKQIDIMVSNPPYVLKSESSQMTKQVLDHEPHLALFVKDNDPLQFYRAIVVKGKVCLCAGGLVYLECNERYSREVAALLESEGFKSVRVHKDISGKDRFVSAVFS